MVNLFIYSLDGISNIGNLATLAIWQIKYQYKDPNFETRFTIVKTKLMQRTRYIASHSRHADTDVL